MGMQAALNLIYPPQCLTCETLVTDPDGLCGVCWRDTPFIAGCVCDKCGVPVPGDDDDASVICDDCLRIARPWSRGRAAMLYGENARNVVLALKHGDRLELARPAGRWLARTATPILRPGMLVAPIPLHWLRLLKRRYNQAALLSRFLTQETGLEHCPDLLVRSRMTPTQDGRGRDGRFLNLAGCMRINRWQKHKIEGRHVLLVDDVMTSGATFATAAETCLTAGAADVSVLSLARVTKDTA